MPRYGGFLDMFNWQGRDPVKDPVHARETVSRLVWKHLGVLSEKLVVGKDVLAILLR